MNDPKEDDRLQDSAYTTEESSTLNGPASGPINMDDLGQYSNSNTEENILEPGTIPGTEYLPPLNDLYEDY